MKRRSLVSVVAIGYNVEGYINECVASIIRQSYENIEIICVDDGSSDSTKDIMEGCAEADRRVRVVSQENKGPYAARMAGLRQARGEYVLFVDGDDWIEPDEVEKTLEIASLYDLDVVLFGCSRDYEGEGVCDACKFDLPERRIVSREEIERHILIGLMGNTLYGSPCNKLFRLGTLLESAERAGDVELTYGEDLLMQLDLFDGLEETYYIDEPLYHYRVHSVDSLSRRQHADSFFRVWSPLYQAKLPYARAWGAERYLNADMFRQALASLLQTAKSGGLAKEWARYASDESFRRIALGSTDSTLVELGASLRLRLARAFVARALR